MEASLQGCGRAGGLELQFYTDEPGVEPVGPWAETAALGSRSAEISRDIWRDLGLTGMTRGHRPSAPGWRRSAQLSRQVPSLRFPVPLQPRRGRCGRSWQLRPPGREEAPATGAGGRTHQEAPAPGGGASDRACALGRPCRCPGFAPGRLGLA